MSLESVPFKIRLCQPKGEPAFGVLRLNTRPSSNSPEGVTDTDSYQFIKTLFGVPTPDDLTRVRGQLRDPGCDWNRIVKDAAAGKILPALQGRMRALDLADALPNAMTDFLETLADLHEERNEAILRELAEIAGILNKVDIEPVVLKGAAYLVNGVYLDLAQRYMLDLDLLVSEGSLLTAVESLKREDYSIAPRAAPSKHHFPEIRREVGVGVELHWQLGVGKCTRLLPSKDVIQLSSRHEFRGTWIRVPSAEHLAVHHVIHSQIQDGVESHVWPSFRVMQDYHALNHWGDRIKWDEVERTFRQNREFGVLASYLLLMDELLHIPSPISIREFGFGRISYARLKLLRKVPMLTGVDPLHILYKQLTPGIRSFQRRRRSAF